jgi:hypothetical protein
VQSKLNRPLPIPNKRAPGYLGYPPDQRITRIHTLFENVGGSLVMGLLAGYFAFRGGASQHVRLFLTTGVIGGYRPGHPDFRWCHFLSLRSILGMAAVRKRLVLCGWLGGFGRFVDHGGAPNSFLVRMTMAHRFLLQNDPRTSHASHVLPRRDSDISELTRC